MSDRDKQFLEYRTERFKKECPVCSDLYHGHYEAWSHQQSKIEKLQEQNAILLDLLKNKPGCKFCVNAHCECVVLFETEINEALEKIKELE